MLAILAYLLLTYTRRVDGISMYPTLQEGDLVVVRPVSFGELHTGDIIVYGSPCSASGLSVIHRVVEITVSGLITKGDNNREPDQSLGIAASPIVQGCVSGKVVFTIPYIERLATLPYGLNYLLVLFFIAFVVYIEFFRGQRVEE